MNADYKKAIQNNLKFESKQGLLTIHQLFTASEKQLKEIGKPLVQELKSLKVPDDFEEFDNDSTEIQKELELKIAIVKDVLSDKKAHADNQKRTNEIREEIQKLSSSIAQKRDEALLSLPLEDQEKRLSELLSQLD